MASTPPKCSRTFWLLVTVEATEKNSQYVDAIYTICVKYTTELSRWRKLHTRTPSKVRPRMHAKTHMKVLHTNSQTTRVQIHSATRRRDAESTWNKREQLVNAMTLKVDSPTQVV